MTGRCVYAEHNFFSADECETLIDQCGSKVEPGKIDFSEDVESNIRRSNVHMITNVLKEADLFYKINKKIWKINEAHFLYDIQTLNFLQFTEYSEAYSGKYEIHTDNWDSVDSDGWERTRKLSFTIQLSDPSKYKGGDLCFPDQPEYNPEVLKDRGTLIVFSSSERHGVTPVTRGDRYSLVGWVLGPYWR